MSPKRIALIGNGGAGKTTTARRIAQVTGIPLHIVDDAQFLPGWERAELSIVAAWHENILTQPAWILDGWGGWDLLEARFAHADLVLLFDYPLNEHLRIARLREQQSKDGDCEYEPPGCRYADIADLMTDTLRRVDRDLLPELRKRLSILGDKVTTIRSLEEIEGTLSQFF